MKFILGVHSKSSNAGVRGELGKYPLLINCVKLMIKYWLRICKMPLNSIIYKCYLENKQLLQNGYNVLLNVLQNMLNYSVNNNIDHFELYSRNRSSINPFGAELHEVMSTRVDNSGLPQVDYTCIGGDILYCGKWRKISKSRSDLDLNRTMPNVELLRAIFIYYNMFKFQVD